MIDGEPDYVKIVGQIAAVPTILEVVCEATGMGFAAVARVTEDRWIACSVKDDIAFGLLPGGELKIETTICHEISRDHQPVVINHVAEDAAYRDHHTPLTYGFQSYISMPIILPGGRFFGTLCAIDPRPAQLDDAKIVNMFRLFADLIAFHLDAHQAMAASTADLADARETAGLREQFIAVLGHDLRSPLAAIDSGIHLLEREDLSERGQMVAGLVHKSVNRMAGLIDDVMDFARGWLGGGIAIERIDGEFLMPALEQVVAEMRAGHAGRVIETDFGPLTGVACDTARISQLFSNLLGNALAYGAKGEAVRCAAGVADGRFTLSVANGGNPIAPEAMARLFSPFARGEVRPHQQGLGLGLYIAAEVARAHGGTLEVASDAAETRFTLTMPVAPMGRAPAA